MPVEHVPAVVARLGRVVLERVLLGVDLLEHRREGQAEALGEAERAARRRSSAPAACRPRLHSADRRAGAAGVASGHLASAGRSLRAVLDRAQRRGGVGTTRSIGGTGNVGAGRPRPRRPRRDRPRAALERRPRSSGRDDDDEQHDEPAARDRRLQVATRSRRTWIDVTARIHTSSTGMSTFQPKCMNWS